MSNRRKIIIAAIATALILIASYVVFTKTMVLLTLIGLAAITIAIGIKFKKGKDLYWLSGAIIAWFIFHFLWDFHSPATLEVIAHTKSFWVFQIMFLCILLACLGRTNFFVFIVRMTGYGLTGLVLVILIAQFTENGAAKINEIYYGLTRNVLLSLVEETKRADKDYKMKPLVKDLKEIKSNTEKNGLPIYISLEQKKREIKELLPKKEPKPKKKPDKDIRLTKSRILSGIFRLPANGKTVSRDTEGRELYYKAGDGISFQQLGSVGKFIIVNRNRHSKTITRPRFSGRAVSDKKIELMVPKQKGGKEILVQVQIKPRRT